MSDIYSVIIPTLNEELYIENCIQSLTKNKLFGLCEILIIDGGSKDKTIDIIKSLQTKYKLTRDVISEAFPDIQWGNRS